MTALALDGLDSMSSEHGPLLGRTEPRLWTPPLRDLTPETSYGFDVIDFARDVLAHQLDPWQEWLVIHGGELLPDGRPRFRKVLVLVARQNGKTELCVVLALYWMYVDRVATVLGTSTKLDYAADSWRKACRIVRRTPELKAELPKGGIRRANGEQVLWRADADEEELDEGSRYKIAASNEEGGRSLTIDRLILDELRQHHDWSAWDASVPAMNAVWDGQAWMITNQGGADSIVLDDQREEALDFIDTGDGDPRLGLFEWSAKDGTQPTDVEGLLQANPNTGRRIDLDTLIGDGRAALKAGGKKLAGFLTENMCMKVDQLDPAVNLRRWKRCGDPTAPWPDIDRRSRIACFELSEDAEHATLAVSVPLGEGQAAVRIRKAWTASDTARDELFAELYELDVYGVAWFPSGPAAAFASMLRPKTKDGTLLVTSADGKDTRRIRSLELRGSKVTEACQGLADLAKGLKIQHNEDPLLDGHIRAAKKQWSADGWRFVRRDAGHVDAAYAAAGATYEALKRPARGLGIRVM